jgi:heme oxygenase
VICAAVGIAAARPFLARLHSRLDDTAAAVGLPVIADGSALLVAVLSVVAPPLGLIALLGLLWLLYRGQQRGEQKYAGLRILR